MLFNGDDTNLYGYCLNDPINLIDPEGLMGVLGGRAQPPGGKIGQDALKGAEGYYKGHKAIALKDYNQYKALEGMDNDLRHINDKWKCIDWDKYGDTFEEAYKNWMKDVLEGKFKPCK